MTNLFKLSKEDSENFIDANFKYFEVTTHMAVIWTGFLYVFYFLADCMLSGKCIKGAAVARLLEIVVPLTYIYLLKRESSKKVMMIAAQVAAHLVNISMVTAVYFLPHKEYLTYGFVIMEMALIMNSLSGTLKISIISHVIYFVEVILASMWLRPDSALLDLLLYLPCILGGMLIVYALKANYYKTYTLEKKLLSISFIDQLTGLNNRHILDTITTNGELNTTKLSTTSFIIMDIDFFKKVNDTYGHDVGDKVLIQLAKIIKENAMEDDTILRWGGEEFLIIKYGLNEIDAYKFADNLRQAVENFECDGIPKITISMGVAEYDCKQYKDTVRRADLALYNAKDTGRNKVVRYSTLSNSYKAKQ